MDKGKQPYLKPPATLFTPDTPERNITLNLSINNITIPTVRLGLIFDTAFNFGTDVTITRGKADSTVKILKTLTSTSWENKRKLSL